MHIGKDAPTWSTIARGRPPLSRGARSLSHGLAAMLLCVASGCAKAEAVEVLHWWTSPGEARALDEVAQALRRRGHDWQDSSVSGGDDRKRLVAQARAGAGREPDAVQLHPFSLRHGDTPWVSWQALATQESWDRAVPPEIQKAAKIDGQWRAVPLNVHRSNWVWMNRKVMTELELTIPRTFEDLMRVASRMAAAGVVPLAHGREPWQDALLFDNAVLSVGGPSLYRRLLVDNDRAALEGPQAVAVFEQLYRLRTLLDAHSVGRPWNFATEMVARGKAGMQITGDWAKPEFARLGLTSGADYVCFPYPGTRDDFVFVVDMFAMPATSSAAHAGQLELASTLMSAQVQKQFSMLKGSIPARSDVDLRDLDSCGREAAADFARASRSTRLVSRFTSEVSPAVRAAFSDTVHAFLGNDWTAREGANELAKAVSIALSQTAARKR
jgi:glucose/mannose transport system substrate-binding protein